MDFLEQLITTAQANFDPLNFIGILVTVIASIYIFKKETSISLIKERHDKLIFPLFNNLEPVLYQDKYETNMKNALCIIRDNQNLADGKLLELLYLCTNYPSKENFYRLCSYSDRAYDKSCRKLGLKTRSFSYRINRKQYKSIGFLIIYAILCSLLTFAVAFAILFTFACGIFVLQSIFESATDTNKIFILFVIIIFSFAFLKFMERHF